MPTQIPLLVVADHLNIRSGPGMDYSVIAVLDKNTELICIRADQYPWIEVATSDGSQQGWINQEWVTTPIPQ